ncbi:unnamed protein product [Arctogadus glacialis]
MRNCRGPKQRRLTWDLLVTSSPPIGRGPPSVSGVPCSPRCDGLRARQTRWQVGVNKRSATSDSNPTVRVQGSRSLRTSSCDDTTRNVNVSSSSNTDLNPTEYKRLTSNVH